MSSKLKKKNRGKMFFKKKLETKRASDSHFSRGEFDYFRNVLVAVKANFEDMESKVNMANNVFDQTKGREVHLASNPIGSKVMDSLLGFIDAEKLETYFAVFAGSFSRVCSDRYASHVLQKMVEIAFLRFISKDKLKEGDSEIQSDTEANELPSAKRFKKNEGNFGEENYNLETKFTQEHETNCEKFLLTVGKYILDNMPHFVRDAYRKRIICTSILCLAGIHVPKVAFDTKSPFNAKNRKTYEVPSKWNDMCKEFARRLEMWPKFNQFPFQENSSDLLRVLCLATQAIDKEFFYDFEKKFLDALLVEADSAEEEKTIDAPKRRKTKDGQTRGTEIKKSEPELAKVFRNKAYTNLLESLITVAGPKLLTQIYSMLFRNKLVFMLKDPLSQYAAIKLVANFQEKEEFENIFEELKEHIDEFLENGYNRLLTSLSLACLRLQTKQAQLIAALQTALHLSGEKERQKSFFLCLIKLKPFEIAQEDKTTFVHLQGSLLIQDLLRFNNPIFLVNCILETPTDYLVTVFNTPNGFHICEHFLQSKFVGEKSHDKLIKQFEGFYVDLAISKWGSRILQSCFASAQDAQKEKIVKELAHKLNILKSTPFGELIIQQLRVDTYRLSAHQWKASLQRTE